MTIPELIDKHVDKIYRASLLEQHQEAAKEFAIELLEKVRDSGWNEYSAGGSVISTDHTIAINKALEELRKV